MILLMAAALTASGADGAIGHWRTETKNGIVEIARCGTSICGKLITSDGLKANPNMLDDKNKDATLRGRKLAGVQLLWGFTASDGAWTGGSIYKADDGQTYKATVTPTDANHLTVKGCWIGPFCKTQTWTRVR